jgi:hypothetical protein
MFPQIRPIANRKHKPTPNCEKCPKPATKEVLYEMEKCIAIHRYCDDCLRGEEIEIPPH